MPLVASPTSDALLYSIDYPTFLYIHLDISIISIFPCICRCMYISYSVMVILAWIVLVCDDDNTVVYNKIRENENSQMLLNHPGLGCIILMTLSQ